MTAPSRMQRGTDLAPPAVPAITVVVCTFRRPEKLAATLTALDRQTVRDRADVVVVDDGPDDDTAAVARRHQVRLVRHARNRGLAAARNTGISAARAPIVAFTDDDCVPADDWLAGLLAQYGDPDVVAVGGGVEALRRTTLVHRYLADTDRLAPLEIELGVSASIAYRARLYLLRNLRSAPARPRVRAVFSLVGANMSFRRDALVAIGLFDERIRFGGEDEDICERLRAAYPTCRLVFTADATIEHDYDGELRDALRRSYQYGAGSARTHLKNPDKNPTLFPAPVLVTMLALVGGIGDRRRWALAAAGAVPFAVFARWPIAAVRRRRPGLLAYPWLQLLEEAAHDVGFWRGWLRLRHEYATPLPETGRVADSSPVVDAAAVMETVA